MQFSTLIGAAATFLASASALQLLNPTVNSTLSKGSDFTINWSTVDTDPSTFSIYISNFATAHWPPTILSLLQNVPTSQLSQTVRIPCDLSSDYGWQFNAINGTNTYVIYAQSPRFSLKGQCVDSVSSAAPSPSSTGFTNTSAAVQTLVFAVSYPTPIVWFQPPNAANLAQCQPAAPLTVTVTQKSTATVCPTANAAPNGNIFIASPPAVQASSSALVVTTRTTVNGQVAPSVAPIAPRPVINAVVVNAAAVNGSAAVNGTKAPVVLPKSNATNVAPIFTGAATSVKVGGAAVAGLAGAIAVLLL